MRLSTRGRYAVMAMVELAAREARAVPTAEGRRAPPVSLAEIAASQMLSLAYLEQLFGPMRRADLVASARGPGGGYRLTRPASEITIAQVVEAVEDGILPGRDEDVPRMARGSSLTDDLWTELNSHVRMFLDAVSIADVLAGRVTGIAVAPARAAAHA
jgi:Rrf2 family transcriptional regulator, iron-sulfur cluster assembly transcription factor